MRKLGAIYVWAALGIIYGFTGFVKWKAMQAGSRIPMEPVRELGAMADKLLIGCAVIFAMYRAFAFHPVWDRRYRDWLKLTPWTPGMPLPLGPAHLTWKDAVTLAAFVALASIHQSFHLSTVLVAFGFAYCLVTALTIAAGEAGRWSLPILAALPVVLLPAVRGWWDAVVIAACMPFAIAGLSASLRRFPWKAGGRVEETAEENAKLAKPKFVVGGMFDALSPQAPEPPIRWWAAAVGCALFGWWFFANWQLAWPPQVSGADQTPMFLFAFGVLAALFRVLPYVGGQAAPISLRGRLATGRWIIPGYDQIFVAPICLPFVGAGVAALTNRFGWHLPATLGVGFSVILFLALKLPPSLGNWKLTAPHHLRGFGQALSVPSSQARAA